MPPKPRSKPNTKSLALLDALNFCGQVTKPLGSPYETHFLMHQNWLTGFNGVLSAGHKIEEDLAACPHSEKMIAALSKCTDSVSITQLESNRLSIKSDKFRAIVPCVGYELMHDIKPDPPIAIVDDRFKTALEIVGILANENAQIVALTAIMMNGQSLISTDRKVIFEAWHGIDLPPNIVLPKAFVAPLVKTKKKLAKFGFSNSSVTFYFDDESWLKTQTYAEPFPDLTPVLNQPSNPWNVPDNFFEAVKAIEPFSEDGNIYFDSDMLRSHAFENAGASYEVQGIPKGLIYPAKQLMMLKDKATKIDFASPGPYEGTYCLRFFGDNVRGIIAGRER